MTKKNEDLAQEALKETPTDRIVFFNESDRNPKTGKPKSVYPMYYFTAKREELESDLKDEQRRIDLYTKHAEDIDHYGAVDDSSIAIMKKRVKQIKAKIKQHDESKPILTGPQKDLLWDFVKTVKEDIRDSMFSHSEMDSGKGLHCDPREECRRMKSGIITIDPKFRGIMNDCGCEVDENGQFSRDRVCKAYQIASATLNEDPSTEKLRRTTTSATFKLQQSLMEMLEEGEASSEYKTRP